MVRGIEFEVGDEVRVEKVTRAYKKALVGRVGKVTEVLPGLLLNGFRIHAGGCSHVFGSRHPKLVRKARDGEHIKLTQLAAVTVAWLESIDGEGR